MTPRPSVDWGPGRGLLTSGLFLASFALAGLVVQRLGPEYQIFGLIDGLTALILIYLLLDAEALSWPREFWGWTALLYATLGTAQLVGALLPPPGVLEWLALIVLLLIAWSAGYGVHRSRLMLRLGILALALAAFRYSFLPFVWSRTQLPRTPVVDLRALGEGVKGLFVSYSPPEPLTQASVFAGLLAWILALWLQWPPEGESSRVRRLTRAERDRLLFWLLMKRGAEGRVLDVPEVRAHLDPGEPEK